MGCDAAIAAPGVANSRYEHHGIGVWRFAVSTKVSLRALYGEGDQRAAEAFARVLDEFDRKSSICTHSPGLCQSCWRIRQSNAVFRLP